MIKDLPPEERLLRLIKGAGKTTESKETAKPPAKDAPKSQGIPTPSFKNKRPDPFKIAVFSLIGIFAIGILYFSYLIFGRKQEQPIMDIEKLVAQELKQPQAKQQAEKEMPVEEKAAAEEPFEEEPLAAKQLFGAPATRETPPLNQEGPSNAELAKDLVLLGVITGNNPQAIIEDKRTRQSFYVYEGEMVLQFKIKKIEKAVVILEYNNETLKLSL